jgi:hypothetical protein
MSILDDFVNVLRDFNLPWDLVAQASLILMVVTVIGFILILVFKRRNGEERQRLKPVENIEDETSPGDEFEGLLPEDEEGLTPSPPFTLKPAVSNPAPSEQLSNVKFEEILAAAILKGLNSGRIPININIGLEYDGTIEVLGKKWKSDIKCSVGGEKERNPQPKQAKQTRPLSDAEKEILEDTDIEEEGMS